MEKNSFSETNSNNAVEHDKPLSPVLNKKRYQRKLLHTKKIKQPSKIIEAFKNDETVLSEKTNIKSGVERKNSSIPVPIKEDYKPRPPVPSIEENIPASTSYVDEFKNEIIYNCARISENNTCSFTTASGKKISISESKIRKYNDLFSDLMCDGDDKFSNKGVRNSRTYDRKYTDTTDVSEASNDIDFSRDVRERSQYINGEDRLTNLSMLYENKKFEVMPNSRTTFYESIGEIDSRDILTENPINVYHNKNFKSSDSSRDSVHKTDTVVNDPQLVLAANSIQEEIETYTHDTNSKQMPSQMNYNIATDESSCSTLDKEIHKLERLLGKKIENKKQVKEVAIFSQPTSVIGEEDQEIGDGVKEIKQNNLRGTSKSLMQFNLTSSEVESDFYFNSECKSQFFKEFSGFTDNEIEKIEMQYEKFKSVITDIYENKIDRCKKMRKKTELVDREIKSHNHKDQTKRFKDNLLKAEPIEMHLPTSKRVKHMSKDSDVSKDTKSQDMSETSKKPLHKEKRHRKLSDSKSPPSKKSDKSEDSNQDSATNSTINNNNNNSAVDPMKSSISLPSNNRVQICIGNNRIKINIKAENTNNNLQEEKEKEETPADKEVPSEPDAKHPLLPNPCQVGFSTAAGNPIKVDPKLVAEAQKKYENEPAEEGIKVTPPRKFLKPKSLLKSRQAASPSQKSLAFVEELPQIEEDSTLPTSSENVIQFGNLSNFNFDFKSSGFSMASGKPIELSKEKIDNAISMFQGIDDDSQSSKTPSKPDTPKKVENTKMAHELIEDVVTNYHTALEKITTRLPVKKPTVDTLSSKPSNSSTITKPSIPKRRLGISRCKPLTVPHEKIEKARQLLEESEHIHVASPSISPLPFKKIGVYTTPIKKAAIGKCTAINTSTPPKPKLPEPTPCEVVPSKPVSPMSETKPGLFDFKPSILFHEKSCYNFNEMQTNIDKEYTALKKKLYILEERKNALVSQKNCIEEGDERHRRQRIGVLLQNKEKCKERIALSKLFIPGEENIDYFNLPSYIFEISPKNADKVHFNILDEENRPLIKTHDGATVIPNSLNIVGVTEISNALQAMEGVDPKLIPKEWVQNHYKWIVWKLAAYERKFPQYFKDCLSVENIMQQLKYRYDKEIDRVERPALRKIFEKDDIPQKRLVLCVADIVQIFNNKFELELTDGWYSIKSIIDAPLCQQIYHNKIKVGTKLMIQGAELLNCDGYYPLDAPEQVRLKISFNCTRRTKWYMKLGYYKIPLPFPMRLNTIHAEGGLIGYVKLYLARIYPIRYVEDHNGVKIWRNEKAEEKRANEFEADRMKELDKIKFKIMSEYENKEEDIEEAPVKIHTEHMYSDIANITCPKMLYSLVQGRDNSESLIKLLTPNQQKSILEYKHTLTSQKQKEMSVKLSKQIEELKMNKRNVTAMLKVLVLDAAENNEKAFVLNLWRPTEEHQQMLKEDMYFSAYNLTIRKTGELSTNNKTYFKYNDKALFCKKVQRQLLPIAMTVDNYYKPYFNEFDTVGIIVQIQINNYDQELWLSDFVGRLLFVRIMDGPKLCALLDNLKRGQVVALSNLTLRKPNHQFGQATANQCSIISPYPQQKVLQQGLELFNQQLPGDTTKLLSDCETRIEQLHNEVDLRFTPCKENPPLNVINFGEPMNDSSDEDSTTFPTRLTKTDIAMSMLDTEQFM